MRIVRIPGNADRSARHVSTPFMPGMSKSTSATCGRDDEELRRPTEGLSGASSHWSGFDRRRPHRRVIKIVHN
jgi:hypothetical protein